MAHFTTLRPRERQDSGNSASQEKRGREENDRKLPACTRKRALVSNKRAANNGRELASDASLSPLNYSIIIFTAGLHFWHQLTSWNVLNQLVSSFHSGWFWLAWFNQLFESPMIIAKANRNIIHKDWISPNEWHIVNNLLSCKFFILSNLSRGQQQLNDWMHRVWVSTREWLLLVFDFHPWGVYFRA